MVKTVKEPSRLRLWQQRLFGRSLARRFLIALLAVSFISSVLLGTASSQLALQSGRQRVDERLKTIITLKQNSITTWISELKVVLDLTIDDEMLEQVQQIGSASVAETDLQPGIRSLRTDLQEITTESNLFQTMFIMDERGKVLVGADPAQEGKLLRNQSYFQEGAKGFYLTPPVYYPTLQETAIFVSSPILDDQGQLVGVLSGQANLDELSRIMSDQTGLGQTGESYLVGSNGVLLTASRFPDFPIDETYIRTEPIEIILTNEGETQGAFTNYRNVITLGEYHWLPDLQVALAVEQEQAEALAPAYQNIYFSIGIALAALIAAAFLAQWMSLTITRPVTRLAQTAQQIAEGNLKVQATVDSQDEIGALAQTFNQMTGQLQQTLAGLEQRVADRTSALIISGEVSRRLSTILDEQELITTVVEQVRNAFNYYHAHIYLLDETDQNLVMAGGTGQAGRTMLANKHSIQAGRGLVGRAAVTNSPVLIKDVSQSPDWLPNPLLPDTQAEIAVPIAVGAEVLGVLDVQHDIANGLDEADVDLLQSLAYQVAISLQNARRYAEVQQRTHEVQESSNFLDSVLENLPNMLFVKDAQDLRFVRFNKAGEELVGISRKEFLGKNDYDFFPAEEAEFFVAKDREVLAGEVLVDIPEEPIHTERQGTRILHTRKVPLLGTDGKPQYLLGISEDITERKQIEAQLENRIQQLNLLSEIGRKAEETNSIPEFLQWVSERLATAVPQQETCVTAITLDDDIYGNEQAIQLPRHIVEGLRVGGELVGRIYIAFESDQDFGDEESALIGSIGQRVANYIETQRLVERTRLLAAIVENHPDFIGVGALTGGKALYINPAGLQMLGYPSDHNAQNIDAASLYPAEDAAKLIQEGIPSALQSGSWSDEAQLLRTDGSNLPIEETIGINYDANGEPVSFSITIRDITERKQTAEVLAKQAKELQIVTEVGTAAAAANNAVHLLETVVNLTQSGFALYHTQIFLLDTVNDALQMAAGSGETGQYLIQEKPLIPLRSAKSLMAQAARLRQGIVASDVRDVSGYLSHPLLSDTRSEIAVPLIAGNELLGVLDVQATEPGYFSSADLPVYTTLATQVAVALQNVRQYEETQRALAEVQALQRSLTREGWQAFRATRERPIRGYRAHQNELEAIEKVDEGEKSFITPVNIMGHVIGSLAVRGEVSPENQALLTAVSQQVGQALERSRLAEQTQTALAETEEQALRLSQLNDMAAALSAASTLGEVLQVAAARTNVIFESNRATLTLLDDTKHMLQVYDLEGEAGAVDTGTKLAIEGTGPGQAIRENRLILVNDFANSPYPEQQKLYQTGLRSGMIAPLSTRSGVIGTLNVSSSQVHAFYQNDESLLRQVASLVATTIESRKLFIEVEDRAAELGVINQVASVVSQQLELRQLLTAVHEQIQHAILNDGFFVATYDAPRDLVHFPFLYDENELFNVDPIAADPAVEVAYVIKTGESILRNYTLEEHQHEAESNDTLMGTKKMPSNMIFVPLKSGSQIIGAISVQNYQFHPYTEADVTLLIGIANHLAVALENARLYTEARRRAERERQVRTITDKIRRATDRDQILQVARQEIGEMLGASKTAVRLGTQKQLLSHIARLQDFPTNDETER